MARSGPISLNRVKPRKTWWKTHDISIWNSPDPAWGARALRRRVVTLSDVTGGRSPVRQPISPQPARERAGYSLAVPGRRTCNMGATKYMPQPNVPCCCCFSYFACCSPLLSPKLPELIAPPRWCVQRGSQGPPSGSARPYISSTESLSCRFLPRSSDAVTCKLTW
jgi:hypothetical protein